MASERASQQAFHGASARLFAPSPAGTIVWGASMSAMDEMPMPRQLDKVDGVDADARTGQTWPSAAASFLGMWVVMMAMMLPSRPALGLKLLI
jgi:predicted metal-binding membrane protein